MYEGLEWGLRAIMNLRDNPDTQRKVKEIQNRYKKEYGVSNTKYLSDTVRKQLCTEISDLILGEVNGI